MALAVSLSSRKALEEPGERPARPSSHRCIPGSESRPQYRGQHWSEERDDTGFLAKLTRSEYLRCVEENHGWFKDVVGPAIHYRLWTANEVFDIVAHDEPVVELLKDT